MKRFSISIVLLTLAQLACQFVAGTHRYFRETVEAGCDADDFPEFMWEL